MKEVPVFFLSGKIYGRILTDRLMQITETKVSNEQGGFRRGKDQIFAIKMLVEEYLGKGKKLYAAFMDLEKAYDDERYEPHLCSFLSFISYLFPSLSLLHLIFLSFPLLPFHFPIIFPSFSTFPGSSLFVFPHLLNQFHKCKVAQHLFQPRLCTLLYKVFIICIAVC